MKLIVNKQGSKTYLESEYEIDALAAIFIDREVKELPDQNLSPTFQELGGTLFGLIEKPDTMFLPYPLPDMDVITLVGLYKQVRGYTKDTDDDVLSLFNSGNRERGYSDETRRERQRRGVVALAMKEEMRTQMELAYVETEFVQPNQET